MTNFKPIYRATKAAIEAEKEQANAWILDQVREVFLKREGMTDEHRAEFMANGFEFRHIAGCTSTGYSWRDYPSSYFHLWRVKESLNSYREFRVVLRKDETINVDKVVNAAINQVNGRLREYRENGIEGTNRVEWDRTYAASPREYEKSFRIGIELSKTKAGWLQVSLRDYPWQFSVRKTIRIRELNAFKLWATVVRDRLIKWTENTGETTNDG